MRTTSSTAPMRADRSGTSAPSCTSSFPTASRPRVPAGSRRAGRSRAHGTLRRRLQSVTRAWLQPPYSSDGWRVDVANMSGRTGKTDANAEVAPTLRAALNDDSLLVAENFHDFRPDFRGWHGVMNYAGFSRPVWTWLRGDLDIPNFGLPITMPRLSGGAAAATMRAFRAGVPWNFTLHSWAILDSHDTPRFRTMAGSKERQLVGIGLQMTTPGVPMVFAGDELGLEGKWGEDARRTMPWDQASGSEPQSLFRAYST